MIGFLLLLVPFSLFSEPYETWQEAERFYTLGELSETALERRDHFNKALSLFADVDAETVLGSHARGILFYNLGNSYFQLGEYPHALLYYYRAEKLIPREERVKQNIQVVLEKLRINASPPSPFSFLFAVITQFSFSERVYLFAAIWGIALFMATCHIWISSRVFLWMQIGFGMAALLLALTLIYSYSLAPVEGVIVRATGLYRDAGHQYQTNRETPLRAGSRLEVLEEAKEGAWLRVKAGDGTSGFVPQEVIRIL